MSTESAFDMLGRMLAEVQSSAACSYVGHERLAITEIFRCLDMCAFAFRMAPNRAHLVARDRVRHWMLMGAAAALKPLLAEVAHSEGPMPWGPSTPRWTEAIEAYVLRCGQLSWLHRLVGLERYGLSRTQVVNAGHMRIEVASDELESADREAQAWHAGLRLDAAGLEEPPARGQLKRLRRRLDKNSGTDMGGWFIRYSGDDSVMQRSLRRVKELEPLWLEAEALPDTAVIGGKTFREWKDACCVAAARVLHHIEFATRLSATHREVDLRNLLTMFIRRSDVLSVWHESGYEPPWADAVTRAMTLDHATAALVLDHHDTPYSFYVDMGREFVLAPAMAALMNPFVDVTRHLRSHYGGDWDRAVDSREEVFRADLARLFAGPRFHVLSSGVPLRRADGTDLTDVDAVILDAVSGTLALVQLKWHDVFAHSLRERESRKRNLLAAAEWVGRVSGWVGERSSADIARQLGMKTPSAGADHKPVILVLTRNMARFSGSHTYDSRSAWLSWPELVRSVSLAGPGVNVLQKLAMDFSGAAHGAGGRGSTESSKATRLQFPGLEVEVVSRVAM
jgi:hypothetical protein